MIVDCISDLHGELPKLEGGDLLIVAGDLTGCEHNDEYTAFELWLIEQKHRKKVVIGGNHDNRLQTMDWRLALEGHSDYLCDSGTEFEGLKIWGSPWTKTFPGMNPQCKAFTVDTEEELAEKWALIPGDTDILVTHSPPLGLLDKLQSGEHVGSRSLYERLYSEKIRPKLHVFGHIHGGYGRIDKVMDIPGAVFVNASIMDEVYDPVNKPTRVRL